VITQLKKSSINYWTQWVNQRAPLSNTQVLNKKNIYILPSNFGWVYGLLLITLFSGAINYQISSIFLMTFLLAVVGLVSAWEAHANLNDLSIQLIAVEDAPLGQPAKLTLLIKGQKKIRFALELQVEKQTSIRLEKIPIEGLQFIVPLTKSSRGCFPVPRITLSSLYPFGIFRVWSYLRFAEHYYVYPQPLSPGFWPEPNSLQGDQKTHTQGDEEFYDLKQVSDPWTQPNLIAWKIAAKDQGWYLKTLEGHEGGNWVFQLNNSPSPDLETKLQHLSYWLIEAENRGIRYQLALAHPKESFGRGKDHLKQALRTLAQYS
jgi:uncharacterized protein (DUF58 family)